MTVERNVTVRNPKMRFQARAAERVSVREQWRRDRAAAQTLRSVFPSVARIHIQLQFEDPAGPSPAAQTHVLHPPARAFFEFPCPYASCEGKFDLTPHAHRALEQASLRTSGKLECVGVRARDAVTKHACGLRLSYVVTAERQTPAEVAVEKGRG